MSSICKHESCDMKDSGTIKGTVITCNCHGSQYDANGKVLNPPSTTNLDHIELTVAMDGTISVNPSKVVPATTRVMA
jgi:Rieske Fe-S protein